MSREWGDDIFDRRCDDEELEDAAKEKHMTTDEYIAFCDEQNAENAISRSEG